MLHLFLLFTFSLSCLVLAAEPPKGHLVAIGGGKTNEAIMKRTLELAGGVQASIVILPQASELPDTGAKSEEMWRGFGATKITVASALNDPPAKQTLSQAALIWIPGGQQTRLMQALDGTGIPALLRERYQKGAVIAGTSAGAAVMSALMITGDADLKGVAPQATKLAEGIGLWPEVIVDQHFLKRQRFNRLLAAVLDHPGKIGVGIDEETAVIVSADRWEVIGNSKVIVLDARGAKEPKAQLHVLSPGMTWKP